MGCVREIGVRVLHDAYVTAALRYVLEGRGEPPSLPHAIGGRLAARTLGVPSS